MALARSQRAIDQIKDAAKQRSKKVSTRSKTTRYEQSGQTHSLDETRRALPASEPPASLPSGLADLERELQNIELNADPRWRTGLDMPMTDYSERQKNHDH